MAIRPINTLFLFALLGFKPILSIYGAPIQKKTEATWDWKDLKTYPQKTAVWAALGVILMIYFWKDLFPAKKSIDQLKEELRQIKLLALPPLEIEKELKEKIDQIQRTIDAYDNAIQSNNQNEILEMGFRLRDLKEDLEDLKNLSAIEKAEHIAWVDNAFADIPKINRKPLVHERSANTPLFEKVDQVIVDLEKRKIIERKGGHLKSKANNQVVLFKREFQLKKAALYNKKNNISTPQTDRLIKEIASQQRRVQQKAVKINQTKQLILEKEKKPLKNKNDIKQAKANIDKLNDEIDTMLRIKPGDLKDQLTTHEWDEIKACFADPRKKDPETREEIENEISRLNRNKQGSFLGNLQPKKLFKRIKADSNKRTHEAIDYEKSKAIKNKVIDVELQPLETEPNYYGIFWPTDYFTNMVTSYITRREVAKYNSTKDFISNNILFEIKDGHAYYEIVRKEILKLCFNYPHLNLSKEEKSLLRFDIHTTIFWFMHETPGEQKKTYQIRPENFKNQSSKFNLWAEAKPTSPKWPRNGYVEYDLRVRVKRQKRPYSPYINEYWREYG